MGAKYLTTISVIKADNGGYVGQKHCPAPAAFGRPERRSHRTHPKAGGVRWLRTMKVYLRTGR
jgi:hypothetical protein